MGQTSCKIPVPHDTTSYVAISINELSKIRIFNAPPAVKSMITRIDDEIRAKPFSTPRGNPYEYYGTLKMYLGEESTIDNRSGAKGSLLCRYFAVRIMEEMCTLGYSLVVSSKLAKEFDCSTWFFSKAAVPHDGSPRVCCLSSKRSGISQITGALALFRHDAAVVEAVTAALTAAWPKGISNTEDETVCEETQHVIKLNGHWGHHDEDGVNTRRAICHIVGEMARRHWRLLTCAKVKYNTDDQMFFIYDENYTASTQDFCIISQNRQDRIRLIQCDELLEPMKEAVVASGLEIQSVDLHCGVQEIKIKGSPWYSSGSEAVRARKCIFKILEGMGKAGYRSVCAIDVSREGGVGDKNALLFYKDPRPVSYCFGCLALTSWDSIQILEFPPEIKEQIKSAILDNYIHGAKKVEDNPESDELLVQLEGSPFLLQDFHSKGAPYHHVRATIAAVICAIEKIGWFVAISADGPAFNDYVHSLYFVKMDC